MYAHDLSLFPADVSSLDRCGFENGTCLSQRKHCATLIWPLFVRRPGRRPWGERPDSRFPRTPSRGYSVPAVHCWCLKMEARFKPPSFKIKIRLVYNNAKWQFWDVGCGMGVGKYGRSSSDAGGGGVYVSK